MFREKQERIANRIREKDKNIALGIATNKAVDLVGAIIQKSAKKSSRKEILKEIKFWIENIYEMYNEIKFRKSYDNIPEEDVNEAEELAVDNLVE